MFGYGNVAVWNVPAITSGSEYVGPLLGESNKCQCSSVVYSMVSACAVCQGGDIETCVLSFILPVSRLHAFTLQLEPLDNELHTNGYISFVVRMDGCTLLCYTLIVYT